MARERVDWQLNSPTMYCGVVKYRYKTWSNWVKYGDKIYTTPYDRTFKHYKRTNDELHVGPPWKTGGPFEKWEANDGGVRLGGQSVYTGQNHPTNPTYYWEYTGGFVPIVNMRDFMPFSSNAYGALGTDANPVPDFGDVSEHGPSAWNRFKPGRPGADLGQFVGEFADTPRMLRTSALGFYKLWKSMTTRSRKRFIRLKDPADHWLNTQFGWLPFVSDLQKFSKSWKNMDRMVHQIVRDNGQWIKRSGTVLDKHDGTVVREYVNNPNVFPTLPSVFYPSYPDIGESYVGETTYEKVWFSARFRYYIPNPGTVAWQAKARRLLYGGGLTPALVWELTPFSWLIDWYTNVGDNIANLDNGLAENLVAKYAYLMGRTMKRYTLYSTHYLSSTANGHWSWDYERKSRVRASPFGFSSSLGDGPLTPWQSSILGALGISRVKSLGNL